MLLQCSRFDSQASSLCCRSLPSRGLQGSIPAAGWDLPQSLTSLGLGNNSISGPLPAVWPDSLKQVGIC